MKDILEKKEYISSLFLIYGSLLSKTMKKRMEDFYLDDLSISEIAQNENVSRNAIFESLKSGEKILLEYEDKLGMYKKYMSISQKIEKLLEEENDSGKKEILKSIRGELDYGI